MRASLSKKSATSGKRSTYGSEAQASHSRSALGAVRDVTTYIKYTVKPGDTWSGISLQNNVAVDLIRVSNGLHTNDSVHTKPELLIPWSADNQTDADGKVYQLVNREGQPIDGSGASGPGVAEAGAGAGASSAAEASTVAGGSGGTEGAPDDGAERESLRGADPQGTKVAEVDSIGGIANLIGKEREMALQRLGPAERKLALEQEAAAAPPKPTTQDFLANFDRMFSANKVAVAKTVPIGPSNPDLYRDAPAPHDARIGSGVGGDTSGTSYQKARR